MTLHQPWAQLMVWGLKNIETRSWAAPRNLIGHRMAIHAGKREPRATDWNIEVQRVVLQRAGGSHSVPMGAVVATARLIECMQVMSEPDDNGLVNCRGFGELGDTPEYDATITVDPYGDFSVTGGCGCSRTCGAWNRFRQMDGRVCGHCRRRWRQSWREDGAGSRCGNGIRTCPSGFGRQVWTAISQL